MENYNKAVGWGDDKQDYADFCLAAAKDESLFANFKQNPKYTKILEHVSPALGWQYYNLLSPETKGLISEAHKINDMCNPVLMEVPEGLISPTTLRYLKVIQDIKALDMKFSNIVEIGGGYGGQARLNKTFLSFEICPDGATAAYTIFDLAGPAALQNRYNGDDALFCACDFQLLNEKEPLEYDLVISNYAFSELDREIQQIYLEKLILPAKHGYLTYNPGQGCEYTLDEIYEILKDKNIKVAPDYPMVQNGYQNNKIITW